MEMQPSELVKGLACNSSERLASSCIADAKVLEHSYFSGMNVDMHSRRNSRQAYRVQTRAPRVTCHKPPLQLLSAGCRDPPSPLYALEVSLKSLYLQR
jgi:hypothetical protein